MGSHENSDADPEREWLLGIHTRLREEQDWQSLIGERKLTLGPLSLVELPALWKALAMNGRRDDLWVLLKSRTVLLCDPRAITTEPDGRVSLAGLDERGKWVRLTGLEPDTVKVFIRVYGSQ